MSHEVESMFSVREAPWHIRQTGDRTLVADEYPDNWDEARRMAGLLWEPRKVPVYAGAKILQRGEEIPEDVRDRFEIVAELADGARVVQEREDSFSFVERDDTNERLAVVNSTLPLISHAQMGELVEAFTEQWRKAGAKVMFETAGSLRGGKCVWVLVRLDEPFVVPGDTTESANYPFGMLTNWHDGTGSCKFAPTNVRIVCMNTCSYADMLAEQTGHQVIIRHSGDIALKIDDAKKTLQAMRDDAADWRDVATKLAAAHVDEHVVTEFVADFIPMPDGATERMRNSRETARATFRKFYESPFTGVPETAYGLFMAATEYLDHARRYADADTYLTRTLVKPQPAKAAALAKIRELVPALGA
jgi:phage/plasmid-like protein (TIGR03299 family)